MRDHRKNAEHNRDGQAPDSGEQRERGKPAASFGSMAGHLGPKRGGGPQMLGAGYLAQEGQKDGPGAEQQAGEEDDGMVVAEVSRDDLEKMRQKLRRRADEAWRLSIRALIRFSSILRAREAGPAMRGGFGPAASGKLLGLLKGSVMGLAKDANGGEDMPDHSIGISMPGMGGAGTEDVPNFLKGGLGKIPVVGTVWDVAQSGIEGENKAAAARAKLATVDGLIDSTNEKMNAIHQQAIDRCDGADGPTIVEMDKATDYTRPAITTAQVDQVIADLDAMLSRALLDVGTKNGGLTTNEYLDRLHARKGLQGEIDRTRKNQDKPE